MVNKTILFFKTLNEKQILLLLLGMAFGLRLYAVLMAKGIAYDSVSYGFMARDFLDGDFIKGLSYPFHPLYPFLISLVSFDSAHVEIAGRLISLFFGTLTLIPVFYLAKEMLGSKGAMLSALLYSAHPYLVTYSGMLLSEATYWGLLTLSVYFFWMGLRQGRTFRVFISGVFLALAYLTRPEGIGYLFVFLLWIAIYGGIKKGWSKKLVIAGGLVLPICIFIIPYLQHIHQETGHWFISKKATEAQLGLLEKVKGGGDPSPIEAIKGETSKKTTSRAVRIIRNVIYHIPFTTYYYLGAYHFSLWLFLFFGLIRIRGGTIEEELFLSSLVLFHLFSLATFLPSTIRFSVPVIPLSLFWAAAGVFEMRRFFQKIKMREPEKWVFFLVVLFILVQLPQTLKPERKHREEQKKVGQWLKENTPKGALIMSNSPQEIFYADREFILLPSGISTPKRPGKSYKEVMNFINQKGIQYILVDKNTREINPGFIESIRESDVKVFHQFKLENGAIITIYKVID
jgi:4-amino-4-deoxy-L-arabinose transferase-like glycosyltransferase